MGRELRRVDLSDPPRINQVWPGFINPFYCHQKTCKACGGSGYSPRANLFQDQWYGQAKFDPIEYGAVPLKITDEALRESVRIKVERSIKIAKESGQWECFTNGGLFSFEEAVRREVRRMFDIVKGRWCHQLIQSDVNALLASNRLWDFTRDWKPGTGWVDKPAKVEVTAQQVNEWSMFGIGHDSINCWICVRARCEREGVAVTCGTCDGEGCIWSDQSMKVRCEEWKPTEPPAGDGYQIWETVSEGSPISPAFSKPEELALWMAESYAEHSFHDWMKFINAGWSPSLVVINGEVNDGVAFVASKAKE